MIRLKKILSSVLEIDPSEINDDLSPKDVEAWNSFNGLVILSELERVFNVEITMEEAEAVKCVKDIKDALKRHGIELHEE